MSPVIYEEFTLRPVDAHDAVLSTLHPLSAFREPPPGSSPSATSSSSSPSATPSPSSPHPAPPPAPTSTDVHVPDVNLPPGQLGTSDVAVSRRYPRPHSGLQLMRLFPPPPPSQFSELKGGPTSHYFRNEERKYFAQPDRQRYAPLPSTLTANMRAPEDFFRNWATAQAPVRAHETHHGPRMSAPAPGGYAGKPYQEPEVSSDGKRRAGKHTKRIYMPYTVPPSADRSTKP